MRRDDRIGEGGRSTRVAGARLARLWSIVPVLFAMILSFAVLRPGSAFAVEVPDGRSDHQSSVLSDAMAPGIEPEDAVPTDASAAASDDGDAVAGGSEAPSSRDADAPSSSGVDQAPEPETVQQGSPDGSASPAEGDPSGESSDPAVEDADGEAEDPEEMGLGLGDAEEAPVIAAVEYRGHVQDIGWMDYVSNGASCGTSGQSKRVEAIRIRLLDETGAQVNGVSYQAHVQDIGWQEWKSDNDLCGTSGQSKRVEAIRIKLTGELAAHYDIYYRVHAQNIGWMAWAKNGAMAGTSGRSWRLEAIQIRIVEKGGSAPSNSGSDVSYASTSDPTISISSHVQDVGWQSAATFGSTTGTTGRGLRVEAFKASLVGSGIKGSLVYEAHVQDIGWQGTRADGKVAGTTGRGLRVEAVRFKLTGEAAEDYDVYYRVHVQDIGWLGWAKNWDIAGTIGASHRIEAMQVRLVEKGAPAPAIGVSEVTNATVAYRVRMTGDSELEVRKYNGATAGATGTSRNVTEFKAGAYFQDDISGALVYSVAAAGKWSGDYQQGEVAVSPVNGKPLDAIRIRLTGTAANYFDVFYRVHVSNVGWLDWTKNGEPAGTLNVGQHIQAIQVRVLMKGSTPGCMLVSFLDPRSGQLLTDASSRQRSVVDSAKRTPSPGGGYCAGWVSQVFSGAGIGYFGGDADDMFYAWCKSSDPRALKVGMIVAVPSHPHTRLGSIYGHVCIYVGDGWVMDNSAQGTIRRLALSDWLEYYGATHTPQWGWLGGVVLS
ncbi:MAG: hypothetical protein IJH87_00075 [Atopobiaceae bacterium]|nr:hypothetical protein [Atopobiaceae bacterium]